MKGPLNVIRRRRGDRAATEADAPQAATETPGEAPATAGSGSVAPPTALTEPPTAEQPTTVDEPVPAGADPEPIRPTYLNRGRLRRRLRYLRRVRELGFRDLGGLVFDQHKFAAVNEELVHGKLAALAAVDAELRALEYALGDRRELTELREPGISVCPRCGALHGSDARYCPSCGLAFHGPRAMAEVGEAVTLPVGEIAAATPHPAATHVAEGEAAKAEEEAEEEAGARADADAVTPSEQPTAMHEAPPAHDDAATTVHEAAPGPAESAPAPPERAEQSGNGAAGPAPAPAAERSEP